MPQVGDLINVTVQKFDPGRDDVPRYETYKVPFSREMRILEALDFIVEELGESVSYQWYCGVVKCGMCGFLANGKPVLGCWEPLEGDVTLEPLPNFSVLRDLVIDRSRYEADVLRLKPWLIRKETYPGFPEQLRPAEMATAVEMTHCVECLLCTSVCPSYKPDSDYPGPTALVQLAKFAFDPRDIGAEGRMPLQGLTDCDECCICTDVCPVGINIRDHAVEPLKRLAGASGSEEGSGQA